MINVIFTMQEDREIKSFILFKFKIKCAKECTKLAAFRYRACMQKSTEYM